MNSKETHLLKLVRAASEIEELESGVESSSLPLQPRRLLIPVLLGIGSLAAAALLMFFFIFESSTASLSVQIAGDKGALFARGQGSVPGDEFWIGVEVERPSFVYLIERTDSGDIYLLYPEASSVKYGVLVSHRQSFGEFQMNIEGEDGTTSRVDQVSIMATETAIEEQRLQDTALIPERVESNDAFVELMNRVGETLGASVTTTDV